MVAGIPSRLLDTGARPGPGRYRCVNCGWCVELTDAALAAVDPPQPEPPWDGTVGDPPHRLPGDAALPACLSCTRGQAGTWIPEGGAR